MSSWNKNVEVGERCVLELPMMATKAQRDLLDKIFRVANDMKNFLIGWYKKQLTEMTRTRRWRENQRSLADLHKEHDPDLAKLEKLDAAIKLEEEHCAKFGTLFKLSHKKAKQRAELVARAQEFKKEQKPLIAVRNGMIKKYGFSKSDFEKRMNIYRSSYTALVGSAVAQRIADNVWSMFDAYLYNNGKGISFSKFSKFLSVEGKSNGANIIFNKKEMTLSIGTGKRHKTEIKVKESKKDTYGYEAEALSRKICYCRIVRKTYPEGWRYFLQLVLDGPPPACF